MKRIFCIGECLIDFMPDKMGTLCDNVRFYKNAGGAPANVAVAAARQDANAFFIGKFASDGFGDYLLKTLNDFGVNTDLCAKVENAKTALAFVSNKEDGDRDFLFYGEKAAHDMLDLNDVKDIAFTKGDVVHFCSVCLKEECSKEAHRLLLQKAMLSKAVISFDVNLRPSLWDTQIGLLDTVNEFLEYCDIVKLSFEELTFLTNESEENNAVKAIFEIARRAKLLAISHGGEGAKLFNRQGQFISKDAYAVDCVDTTGAGDCFVASLIVKLPYMLNCPLEVLSPALEYANAAAAIAVTKRGSMEVMPTSQEISRFISRMRAQLV